MTPRLQMEKDVERVVEQHFEENWTPPGRDHEARHASLA